MEKMTKPANMLVQELMQHTMIESLRTENERSRTESYTGFIFLRYALLKHPNKTEILKGSGLNEVNVDFECIAALISMHRCQDSNQSTRNVQLRSFYFNICALKTQIVATVNNYPPDRLINNGSVPLRWLEMDRP